MWKWKSFYLDSPQNDKLKNEQLKNNLVTLHFEKNGIFVDRWLPFACAKRPDMFTREVQESRLDYPLRKAFGEDSLKKMVTEQIDLSSIRPEIDSFCRNSSGGDCYSYLLQLCLRFIDCQLADEEEFILLEGTDPNGNNHCALEIKGPGQQVLFTDPAFGFWLIRGKTEIINFYDKKNEKDISYQKENDSEIYSSKGGSYEFTVTKRITEDVIERIRQFVLQSIQSHVTKHTAFYRNLQPQET